MKQIKVTNIKWDAPAEAGLPLEVTINIDENNKHLLDDMEGEMEALSDYLSDTYEYCHFGFLAKVINSEPTHITCQKNPNKKSKYTSIGKLPHEGKKHIYIAGWLTHDDNENGEIIASINISSKEIEYIDEDAKADEYAQLVINEVVRSLLPENFIRVKIPSGYLMVEIKGTETEFPGVFVSFSEDGKAPDLNNLIACVEYDTVDNEIKTETYCEEHDNPVAITYYASGEVV